MKITAFILFLLIGAIAYSQQDDPEFPKGFVMHARLHSGLRSEFNSSPALFIGGLQIVPQATIIEHKLRAGVIAGSFYMANKLYLQFGPTASFKLKTFNAGIFGSAANLHVSVDHLWGSGHQRLLGGGFNLDLLNLLIIGLSAHRDYKLNNWWLQQSVGVRISKKKKVIEPFN
jgi:hypothetical protein